MNSIQSSILYGELGGLSPLLIHAAEYDVFLSDSTRFADLLVFRALL